MNSPTQLSGVQQRLAQSSSPYFQIALYAAGNVLAVAILLLVWFGWGILAAFQEPLLWAWLCSLSLRDVKRYLVSTARRELLSRCESTSALHQHCCALLCRYHDRCTAPGCYSCTESCDSSWCVPPSACHMHCSRLHTTSRSTLQVLLQLNMH
jgi:hypothetical protein